MVSRVCQPCNADAAHFGRILLVSGPSARRFNVKENYGR